MRGRLLSLFLVVLALAIPAAGTSTAAADTSGATLSQPVTSWLAKATKTSTFPAIVTFDSYAAMSRIDSLGVGATKLDELPIAFATLTAAQVRQVASWPETRSIWHNQANKPVLDESVPLIGADRVRAGSGL